MIESSEAENKRPFSKPPVPIHDPEQGEPAASSGMVQAAAILAIGNIVQRILGLARETVKANLFGASPLLAAFEIAAYVPMSLFDLIVGGLVNSSLIPVFSEYATKERRDELWGLLSIFLSVITLFLLLVILFVELFAPWVAWAIGARNFSDPTLTAVSIRLMRMATPAILFLSIASILTGALYALKRFTIPAFVGATFNATIVVVALIRPHQIESLVWGLLLGSSLQIIIQLPALKDMRLRLQLQWQHPAIRRILILYAPIAAGLVVNQLAIAFSYNLATRTLDAGVTYMKFATTLFQFPLGLVVTALSLATLPTLSQQAQNQLTKFKQTFAEGLRLVLVLILPATAGLFALAGPIVALIFERGEFTAMDTEITATVLRVYLFGLPFAAVDQMLVFASYARKDTWRPALVGVISILFYSATAVFLIAPFGLLSLMVADAVKHIVHTVIMLWLFHRHLGSLVGHQILSTLFKSAVVALLTGFAAFEVGQLLQTVWPAAGFLQRVLVVTGAGGVGLLLFVLTAYLFDIQEIRRLYRLIQRPPT